MPLTFLGIYREPENSPGRHASNDARILALVGRALERAGASVRLSDLAEARALWKRAALIFSMCQGPDALAELGEWQAAGAHILNDPAASRRTYRDHLCAAAQEKELHFPRSLFVPTDAVPIPDRHGPLFAHGSAWLKRMDVHATGPGDVVKLERFEQLQSALERFRARGFREAVLQQHHEGDEVKFYAVRGGRLFWPYYPNDCEGYPFDEKELRAVAEEAASALGIAIYGGDAIIAPDGSITLIDLNDWPSFAPCRGAAAGAIARYLKEAVSAIS